MKGQLMKKLVGLTFLFIISCVSTQHRVDRDPQGEGTFKPETIQLYGQLAGKINESILWRQKSAVFYNLIVDKNKKGLPLTAEETDGFFAEARSYLALRKELLAIKDKFVHLVKKGTQSKVVMNEMSSYNAIGLIQYKLNPKDEYGRELLFGLRVSLTAALILYDNFLTGIKPHYDNAESRTKLKFDAHKDYENAFDSIVKSFFDVEQRQLLSKAMNLFLTDYNLKKQYQLVVPDVEENLNQQILNSVFYNYMKKEGLVSIAWSDKYDQHKKNAEDAITFTKNLVTFGVSFTFGNIVGSLNKEDRTGDLLKLPVAEKQYIKTKLKPFDILLEKTPFKRTDSFIPGYYGHVAIYLGTKEQLTAEGLWNYLNPKMKAQIEKGETILEALRYDERYKPLSEEWMKGVQLNSLEHFLNIDELLVIRSRTEFTSLQKNKFMKNAVEQFGKKYDFNFDTQSKDKIVCSELAFVVIRDDAIEWPNEKSVGRFTISPDHVMTMAFPGKPFQPVLIYDKNGERKENTKDVDLSLELFRNIQNNYMDMVYKEESIYVHTAEPQEVIHLASGIASLQKRIDMIRSAKDTIDMEYFIYKTESDIASRYITQELIKKAQEKSLVRPNENIRIRLLVDSSSTVLKLKDVYATMLRDNNIRVRYYNQTESPITNFMKANQRNHRKSLIIDGVEAITGGRNIGSEYFDLSPDYNFLDTDIYIKGSIAKTIKDSFDSYWFSPLSSEPKYLVLRKGNEAEYNKETAKAKQMITFSERDKAYRPAIDQMGPEMLKEQYSTTCKSSTFVSDMPSDNKNSRRVLPTIKAIVGKATQSMTVESPYFVISEMGTQVFNALLKKPGFILNIQTNSLHSTDASYTTAAFYPKVSEWTSRGVNMWIYKGDKPNPDTYMRTPVFPKDPVWGIHSKRAVVDEHTTLIGTFNVDPRSANLNNEMVYICHDNPGLAKSVLDDMKKRRDQSAQLGPDGLPLDKSNIFQNASNSKKAQYLLLKKLVEIPALRDLL